MAERVHIYEDESKKRFYLLSNSTNHVATARVKWKGVTKALSESKNLTLGGLEALGDKELETEEDLKKTKTVEAVSTFIRNLAEKISKEQ